LKGGIIKMQDFVVILEKVPSAQQLKDHLNENGIKAVVLEESAIENIFNAMPDETPKTVVTDIEHVREMLKFIANYPSTEGIIVDEELEKFFVVSLGTKVANEVNKEFIQEIIEKEQEFTEIPVPARFIPSKVRPKIFDDFLEKIPETQDITEDHAFLAVQEAIKKLHQRVLAAAQKGDNVVEISTSDFKPLRNLIENLPSMVDAGVVLAAVIGLLKQTGLTFESIAYLLSALKIPSKFKRGNWNADQVKYYYRVLRTKLDLQSLNDMFFGG